VVTSKKRKRGKCGGAAKKERDCGMGEEDSSLRLESETEPGKSC
jgi:hypothetical protein